MVTVQGKTGSVWEIKLKTHEEITFTTAVPRLSPAPDFSLQALLQAACFPSALRVGQAVGRGSSLLLRSSHFSPLLCHGFSTGGGAFRKVLLQRELSTGCGGDLLHLGAPLPQPHPPPTPVFLVLFLALFFFLLSLGCSSVLSSVFPEVP